MCRIQEACVFVDMEKVMLQLWDCSGDVRYRKYWTVMAEVSSEIEVCNESLF